MKVDIYDLNCPFCEKVYKLPREKVVKHIGKTIYCRGCGNPFSVPPLPVFESNVGVVLDSPRLVDIAAKTIDAPIDVPVESDRLQQDRFTNAPSQLDAELDPQSESGATNGHYPAEESLAADLPPPFSAEVLPPIEDVLPAIDEPPSVDLAAEVGSTELSDIEPPPYRGNTEHGAVTVDEEASYFHDENSSEGASAGDALSVDPIVAFDNLTDQSADSSAADFDTFAPEAQAEPFVPPTEPEPAAKADRPKRFVASSIKSPLPISMSLPNGLNLDDVPIARAVASTAPPQPMLPPTTPLNFRSLRSRLTLLIIFNVTIVLLLAAILLALLGYIPHRPA